MLDSFELKLSELEPDSSLDLFFQLSKLDANQAGSFLQILRRPARLPDVYRPYISGDPTTNIDWRAYARSDSLLIREVQDEAGAKVKLLIDLREGMNWPDRGVTEHLQKEIASKAAVAIRLSLYLAYLHQSLGDRCELRVISQRQNESFESLPVWYPKGVQHIDAVFIDWKRSDYKLETFLSFFEEGRGHVQKADITYVISDFLDEVFLPETKELAVLHTLCSLEVNTSWLKDHVSYIDPARSNLDFSGKSLLMANFYQERLKQFLIEKKTYFLNERQSTYQVFTENSKLGDLNVFICDLMGKRPYAGI